MSKNKLIGKILTWLQVTTCNSYFLKGLYNKRPNISVLKMAPAYAQSVTVLNQFGHGGDKRPPDFQNSSKKIISHRLRVIKV